jgi:hypothetical protein
MRTSIYIDGFNLYYRAIKGTPYKWLDLKQLAVNLLQPHHVITEINILLPLSLVSLIQASPFARKRTFEL